MIDKKPSNDYLRVAIEESNELLDFIKKPDTYDYEN